MTADGGGKSNAAVEAKYSFLRSRIAQSGYIGSRDGLNLYTEPRQMHNSVYLAPELFRILNIKPKQVTELES